MLLSLGTSQMGASDPMPVILCHPSNQINARGKGRYHFVLSMTVLVSLALTKGVRC